MRSLQEQYNKIKEGKGSKYIFLKEAKRQFPNLIRKGATYSETVKKLDGRNIIKEDFIGYPQAIGGLGPEPTELQGWEESFKTFLNEEAEVKAEIKKPAKEVEDSEENTFENTDDKNLENQIQQQVFNGIMFEATLNPDKEIEEIKKTVSKNLAKDELYYLKNAMFGIEGIGFEESPESEVKGKFAESGYSEKVKELVKEALARPIQESGFTIAMEGLLVLAVLFQLFLSTKGSIKSMWSLFKQRRQLNKYPKEIQSLILKVIKDPELIQAAKDKVKGPRGGKKPQNHSDRAFREILKQKLTSDEYYDLRHNIGDYYNNIKQSGFNDTVDKFDGLNENMMWMGEYSLIGSMNDETDVDEAAAGFGTGQGRSKTISKGREFNPDLKQDLKDKEPKRQKYTMKNGIPHRADGTPWTRKTNEGEFNDPDLFDADEEREGRRMGDDSGPFDFVDGEGNLKSDYLKDILSQNSTTNSANIDSYVSDTESNLEPEAYTGLSLEDLLDDFNGYLDNLDDFVNEKFGGSYDDEEGDDEKERRELEDYFRQEDEAWREKMADRYMEEGELNEELEEETDVDEVVNEFEEGEGDLEQEDEEKPKKMDRKPKVKKETLDTRLAEIDRLGGITTLEAKIETVDEEIASRTERMTMIGENQDLADLIDSKKLKSMQKDIKDLEKRSAKLKKLYERTTKSPYIKQEELVDEGSEEQEQFEGSEQQNEGSEEQEQF